MANGTPARSHGRSRRAGSPRSTRATAAMALSPAPDGGEPAPKRPKVPSTARHAAERRLGSAALTTTQLGLGGASLGDLFCKIPNSQALDTVTRCHELGVRYFDTAPWYGIGLSEARMGLALSALPRDSYTLSTKVGRYLRPHGDEATWDSLGWAGGLQNGIEFAYTYDDIMRQYEDSVQRLGCGRVDCLVIHDIEEAEGQSPTHARGTREFLKGDQGGYRALEKLRAGGKIKAFGAGINIAVGTPNHTYGTYKQWNLDYFQFLLDCAAPGEKKIDFVLLAGTYTLLDLSAWETGLLDRCHEHGVGVVMGGAFNSGVLATGAVEGAKFNYDDASLEILDRTRKLEAVCSEFGVPLAAVALQFSLGHPAVTTVIPGCKSVAEAERSVATMNLDIPEALWAKLKAEQLLPQGVPTPS